MMKVLTVNSFMNFDVELDCLLIGYAAKSCRQGKQVPVIRCEFSSSEDGDSFVSRLEEFPSLLLNKIREQHKIIIVQSSIDNMLAILRRDKSATIYINAPMKALMQVKKSFDAGQEVYQDDIADIKQVVFEGVSIPTDTGIMVLFSVGWRKGFYFDLMPLSPNNHNRNYDIHQLLGGYYAYLTFQERFKISDQEWDDLLKNGWFPFITLKRNLVGNVLNHNKEGWNVDELLPKIQKDVLKRLPEGIKTWTKIKSFKPHIEFISKAVEHYEKNDYISSVSVLFPRIEGIMREFQSIQGQPEKSKQVDLADTVLSSAVNPKEHQLSPLLPLRFNQYLNRVYFANFDPLKKENTLSRNTVGHGIATKENFDLKGATLGFLILDQLSYYFCGIS